MKWREWKGVKYMTDFEGIELDVGDFLEEASRVLPKKAVESLEKFLEKRKEEFGEILITTEEIALFLIEECRVPFPKVALLLKHVGISDEDLKYIYAITRPAMDESR